MSAVKSDSNIASDKQKTKRISKNTVVTVISLLILAIIIAGLALNVGTYTESGGSGQFRSSGETLYIVKY